MKRYVPTFESFVKEESFHDRKGDNMIGGDPEWYDKNDPNYMDSPLDEELFNIVMDAFMLAGSDDSVIALAPKKKRDIQQYYGGSFGEGMSKPEIISMYARDRMDECPDQACANLAQAISYRSDEIKPNEGYFALEVLDLIIDGKLLSMDIVDPKDLNNKLRQMGILSVRQDNPFMN